MIIKIPYGKSYLNLESSSYSSCEVLDLRTETLKTKKNGAEIVAAAMCQPIGSPLLGELAVNKKNAVIIISDHTRPVPSKQILPAMLAELRRASPDIDITLLVATGCHRATTQEEIAAKVGDDIAETEKIVIHDCMNEKSNVFVGILPSEARLVINRLALETELLLAEGFIEPHFFAGFSGGRKSILPGICDRVTVLGNHCSEFIASANARTGILENNPIHCDMLEAVRLSNLCYIVNVILDSDKNLVAAFAGHPVEAHLAGCRELGRHCCVAPSKKGDIVLTSNGGEPLDQNIYQAVKSMATAEAAAADGAVLIVCARCKDGVGGDFFYKAMRDCESPSALLDEIQKTPMEETVQDQWQYQILARILEKHRVILVTDESLAKTVNEMKLEYAKSIEAALDMAYAEKGSNAHLVVIPDGVSVIVSHTQLNPF